MPLKPDEVFVQNLLLKHLELGKECATEGDDPPDLFFDINGEKVGVEVTRLSPVVFDKNWKEGNRNTQDEFGLRIISEANSKYGSLVPDDLEMILVVDLPVPNGNKFKKTVFKEIENVLSCEDNFSEAYKEKFRTDFGSFEISFFKKDQDYDVKIHGFPIAKNHHPNVGANLLYLLYKCIEDKKVKCAKAEFDSPMWLALINDFPLVTSIDSYDEAFLNIEMPQIFEKIFIINDSQIKEFV